MTFTPGLVRTGQKAEAIRFLQETRKMSRKEAANQVTKIAVELGPTIAWTSAQVKRR